MLNHVFQTDEVRMVAGKHVLILTMCFRLFLVMRLLFVALAGLHPRKNKLPSQELLLPSWLEDLEDLVKVRK